MLGAELNDPGSFDLGSVRLEAGQQMMKLVVTQISGKTNLKIMSFDFSS